MKKKTLLSICILFIMCVSAVAQEVGALTIFSENGEKFYLILNGLRQNNVAQTNVRVDGLNQPSYTAKIIFEDKTLPEVSRNYLMICDADKNMMDVTYKIKHDKSGMPKLGMMPTSFIPYKEVPAAATPDVYVVHYGTPDPMPATTTVSQTTTTTTAVTPNTGGQVNINGVNMGVSVSTPGEVTTQTTTTRTTTTTTGGEPVGQPIKAAQGCAGSYAMMPGDFGSAVNTIKKESFDDTKLSTAKQIAGGNCLNAGQIADICKLFSFEEKKLDFAKFAYNHCTDVNNYFKVNGVFTFSSSTEDLNKYIQSKQ